MSDIIVISDKEWKKTFDHLDDDLSGLDFFDTNGFISSTWGKYFWVLKHSLAIWVDEESKRLKMNKQDVKANLLQDTYCVFIDCLTLLLPCALCRQRFEPWVAANPPQPHKNALWKYTFIDHNVVNTKVNKPIAPDSEEEKLHNQYKQNMNVLTDVTEEWQKGFWIILFLLALNLPNPLDRRLPRHEAIYKCLYKFLQCLGELIPESRAKQLSSPQLSFKAKWNKEFKARESLLAQSLLSRKEMYKWTWMIQEAIGPCFQQSCRDMCVYIESTFRVHDKTPEASTFQEKSKELKNDTKKSIHVDGRVGRDESWYMVEILSNLHHV